jgi:tripartite-type tricarboxylate transporter receptor subunit TctC
MIANLREGPEIAFGFAPASIGEEGSADRPVPRAGDPARPATTGSGAARIATLAAQALAMLAIALLSPWPQPAQAQAYPNNPVRIVIGYPPGGSADFTARVLAEEMSKDLGTSVLVDNRPGAGTTIASDLVAKARPDGYTLLLNWHQSVMKAQLAKLPYDPEKDLAPIGRVATGMMVLVVNNATPFTTLRELISYAKANPGKLNAASGGFGSAPHMAAAQFEAVAGVKIVSIQFKGGGPASQSLLAGDTQLMFAPAPTVTGFIKAGKVRPLAVTLKRGSPSVPGIPGTVEAGLPEFESTFWFGLFAPAGTPAAIVRRLHAASVAALDKAELRTKFANFGMDPTPSASPAAFDAELKVEGPQLEKLIKSLGAKPQ